jgi:Fe2+ transport system protein FeoA
MHLAHKREKMERAAKSASGKSLYDFPRHSNLRIRLISGDWEVRRSFNQLGLFEGDRVRVVRKAPFGGPIILEARGAKVAISKQLAQMIRVEALT